MREVAVISVALLALSGCGGADTTAAGQSPDASVAGPATELTIAVDDGAGKATSTRLTCDPVGGDHTDPPGACEVLERSGERALPAGPKDQVCTEIFGGPQTARITGTWRDKPVDAQLSRKNGCEISRWDALRGLLPEA